MDWKKINRDAKQWIQEAGKIIRASFDQTLDVQTKSNRNDLVTNMDKEIEQYFIKKIRDTYPTHRVLGEEGFGDQLEGLDGVVWMLDPIDGTMNFIHQQRNFAISLGIYEEGIGKIGFVYDVAHDELYHAIRGQGAYLNEESLPSLQEVHIEDAILAVNSTWLMENQRMNPNLLTPLAKTVRGTRSYGTAALELIYVATGRVDAYISLRLAPWDFAGGAVIVEELGGIITNLKGETLDYLSKSSILAAKPGLHRTIMKDYLNEGNW